ncbi:MAG: hypothetical protein ED556_01900 [Winogradskyella sp.]|uniref:hypothetical protein n=1 Tax=Winogradskyella sp. TaxID=1883156 RepID=UPI000F3E4BBF|nr:hypothetical protein [Winogradskyella sp.]RNC87966.1 MAG: hypothetical protein ED556_01900 [Winogradskyella sp.]
MNPDFRHKGAMIFAILFMIIVTAPAVILSVDDNVDVTFFFGENEEEETENLKLLFETSSVDAEKVIVKTFNSNIDSYTFKNYSKPELNLIFPPPDFS